MNTLSVPTALLAASLRVLLVVPHKKGQYPGHANQQKREIRGPIAIPLEMHVVIGDPYRVVLYKDATYGNGRRGRDHQIFRLKVFTFRTLDAPLIPAPENVRAVKLDVFTYTITIR